MWRKKVYKIQKKDCWRQFRRETEGKDQSFGKHDLWEKNLNNESCVTLARDDWVETACKNIKGCYGGQENRLLSMSSLDRTICNRLSRAKGPLRKKFLSQVKWLSSLLEMLGNCWSLWSRLVKHPFKFVRLDYAVGTQDRVNHVLQTLSALFFMIA